jgi:hypothetical protein
MRKISVLFFAVLFAGATLCTAQQRKSHHPQNAQQKTKQQQKWEVFTGYTLSRDYGFPNLFNSGTQGSNSYDEFAAFNLQGGQASATYFATKHFGITGDFTALTKNQNLTLADSNAKTQTVHEQDYLFGPTYSVGLKGQKISLFAHQLFGVAHTSIAFTPSTFNCYISSTTNKATCSGNPFAMATGGGVDIVVNSHLSIRPAQLDYWTYQLSEKKFFGSGLFSDGDSAKLGVDGFRYSAGAVFNF